jgi:lysosomal Pro-X carboxypeptidase
VSETEAIDECIKQFGVQPRSTWITTTYGGHNLQASPGNIVLSNGLLDPWSGTGVLEDVSDTCVAYRVTLCYAMP